MNTTTMIETSTPFYTSNSNTLQPNNADVYNVMYNAPYQNLPNGRYTTAQSQPFETRYPAQNAPSQPTLTMATGIAAAQHSHLPPPPPPQQQHQQQSFQDMAEKMASYAQSVESPKKSVRFAGSNNSGNSTSNSEDSNNDSDSSSNDSDVEKDDKENHKQMLVKPLRINLNNIKVCAIISTSAVVSRELLPQILHFIHFVSLQQATTDHGSPSYIRRPEQHDSANEDDTIEENNAPNALNDKKYHSNMSDITNIQMQFDNIKVFITFGSFCFSDIISSYFCRFYFNSNK